MTDFDERPPGPPLDQHMSFLISSEDRQPLLGLAGYATIKVGRDVQESVFIRRALRIGTRTLLDELEPGERRTVDTVGQEALAVLADKRKAAADARAERNAKDDRPDVAVHVSA